MIRPMSGGLRTVVRRIAQIPLTLIVLSAMVFLGGQILPGNVGRNILGPFADEAAVQALNRQLGLDRPLLVQFWTWISHLAHGDMGISYVFKTPVAPLVMHALANSAELAFVTLLVVVPLGIFGGVLAALNADRPIDRLVTLGGLSASVVPEFVTGIVLILIFGVTLRWLPISAAWPEGAGLLTQLYHLILPTMPLVLVLFGYLARMARAGVIETLGSDYVRTAVLKGLSRRRVIWRHVLRNALIPTITVIGTQSGNLIGGLVVVETLFRYQGVGSLIFKAARGKDFPVMEAGILTVGLIFSLVTLCADLLTALLNPRVRLSAES